MRRHVIVIADTAHAPGVDRARPQAGNAAHAVRHRGDAELAGGHALRVRTHAVDFEDTERIVFLHRVAGDDTAVLQARSGFARLDVDSLAQLQRADAGLAGWRRARASGQRGGKKNEGVGEVAWHASYDAAMSREVPSDFHEMPAAARLRIDKWLWAARFFKTRGLAQDAVEGGRVRMIGIGGSSSEAGERIKASREVRPGDVLLIQIGDLTWNVTVRGLSDKRGPAPVARELYEESPASQAARLARIEMRRIQAEPSSSIKGRPTKKDRRQIHRFTE